MISFDDVNRLAYQKLVKYDIISLKLSNDGTFGSILLFVVFDLLHLILYGIYFKCPLPETDRNGIRTLLFLDMIFSLIIIIYCIYKCKSVLETAIGLLVPSTLGLVVFFPWIIRDLNEISESIENPLNVTKIYPCSLSFYRVTFGLVLYNYVIFPVLLLVLCPCIYFSNYGKRILNRINPQVLPERTS